MGYHSNEAGQKKLVEDLNRICNDRARLEYALRQTLKVVGVNENQVTKIVSDVRLADFDSLKKTMKITADI